MGGRCNCVACSPCGRYIAGGAGKDIVIIDASSGEILRRLRSHSKDVRCITFFPGCTKIVSGSDDGKVIVWEWESLESPAHVREGHSDWVRGVAVSRDGQRIYSGSEDGSLRIWNVVSGVQVAELAQNIGVKSVAVCGQTGRIALGLRGGKRRINARNYVGLRILNSSANEVQFENIEERGFSVCHVSFCLNGLYLAMRSSRCSAQLWNARACERMGKPLKMNSSDCDRCGIQSRWKASGGEFVWLGSIVGCCVWGVYWGLAKNAWVG